MSVVGSILLAGFGLLLSQLAVLGWRWRIGKFAKIDWRSGLKRVPTAYLHDVHSVVARQPEAARMHMLVAGGLVSSLATAFSLQILNFGRAIGANVLLLTLTALAAGIVYLAKRRWPPRPARFSAGGYDRLPVALGLYCVFLLFVVLPDLGWVQIAPMPWNIAIFGAVATVWLTVMIGRGPMKHAVAGLLHLIVHHRPSRFGSSKPDAALTPLDLESQRLGVEKPADFAWNQLVGFDSCVQCGRCEVACPAFAAGQPLNPKKLIQDLAASLLPAGAQLHYAGRSHPGVPIQEVAPGTSAALITGIIHPDTLWACTTCRACVEECPMMIEHVDAVVDLRRFQTLELGSIPPRAAEALGELRAADNFGGRPASARIDWAIDLALPQLSDTAECEVLLWLGEGAFELRNQRTLRALIHLLRHANINFAVLGEAELDCGDLARRLGDEATFQDLARRNIALLAGKRFRRILTADPHVLHCLRNEYPAFGGKYDVVHHAAFLAELIRTERLNVHPRAGRVTYHDPCYLGRYNGETDEPRAVIAFLGADLIEMERSRMSSRCCGGGGGAPFTDIPGARRIPDLRMDDARTTGAPIVAVACPNCMTMLEGVVGDRPDVLDIAELLHAAVEGVA